MAKYGRIKYGTGLTSLEEIKGMIGSTPSQVWGHDDRRLTSRDIDSEELGESLPSEEHVQTLEALLNLVKGQARFEV